MFGIWGQQTQKDKLKETIYISLYKRDVNWLLDSLHKQCHLESLSKDILGKNKVQDSTTSRALVNITQTS